MSYFKNKMVIKTVLVFFAVFVLLIAVTNVFAYVGFTDQLQNEFGTTNISMLKQLSHQTEQLLREIDRQSIKLTLGMDTRQFMKGHYVSTLQRVQTIINLQAELSTLKHAYSAIDSIGLYSFESATIITDRYHIPYKDYYDLAWIDALDISQNHCWLDARIILDENNVHKSVITLVRTFPLGLTQNPSGLIFINVKRDSVNEILQNLSAQHSSRILVTGSSENSLMGYSDVDILQEWESLSEILSPAQALEQEGVYSTQQHSEKYSVFYTNNAYMGWRFYSIYPHMDLQAIQSMRNNLVQLVLLAVALVIPLALFMTRYTFRPVYHFWDSSLRVINAFLPAIKLGKDNISLDRLEEIFSDTLSSNRQLEEHLLEKKQLVKWRLVTDLLTGYRKDAAKMEEELQFIGRALPYPSFCVLTLFPDDMKELAKLFSPEQTRTNMERIILHAESILNRDSYAAMAIELNETGIGILINIDCEEDFSQSSDEILSFAEDIRRYIKEQFGFTVTVGVGSHTGFAEIRESYMQSLEAAKYRAVLGGDRVIFAGDLSLHDMAGIYKLYTIADTLIQNFKSDSEAQIRERVQGVYSEVQSRRLSLDSVRQISALLIMFSMKICNESGVAIEELMAYDDISVYNTLAAMANIEEIENYTQSLLISFKLKIQQMNLIPYSSHIMPKIIQYIEMHYVSPDMSLVSLAEEFHVSVPYLSRLFKENMHTNYTDYLTQLRLEKAKELLKQNNNIKIAEVAERVGYQNNQSFIRAFKRYTSLTPGSFRSSFYLSRGS